MMVSARTRGEGIELLFADGRSGLIPLSDIPEVASIGQVESLELPNAYELHLRTRQGELVELPWDFARHYCDPAYEARVSAIAATGRASLGQRLRRLREEAGVTQAGLAATAGIGRVTLVRIEQGEQSPRFDTLMALAKAIGVEPAELLSPGDNR